VKTDGPAGARLSAPARISLLYAAFGLFWVVVGDVGVSQVGGAANSLGLHLAKGIVFVLFSTALVYRLVQREMRAQQAAELSLRKALKLDAVARLAGGIAHEFNNILTTIVGHATLLLERPDVDTANVHAEEVRRAASRASSLTRQLLVFSGAHVNQPSLLDISAMLEEARAMLQRTAGEAITLDVVVRDPLWSVWCDVAQLQQVLLNLVLNAQEATPADGRIVISAENLTLPATANGIAAGDWVRLRVADSGSGMSADALEHIFEPFFTTKENAAGLGLPTVHGIVRRCGGHVRVDSVAGRGTTVDVLLPRGRTLQPASGAAPAPPRPATPYGTILVVEDDAAVRDLTLRILRRAGHAVLSACNAADALRMVNEHPQIRLVVADIVMPGMNGIELGRHLRIAHPDLPILFTSGYTRGSLADTSELQHGTDFLEKPYRPDELVQRVACLLSNA